MAAVEQTCQSSLSGRTSLWEAGGGKRKRRKARVGWRGEVRINIWHGERLCEESRSARSTNNVMIYYGIIQTVTNTLKNQGASGELQHPRVFPPSTHTHTHGGDGPGKAAHVSQRGSAACSGGLWDEGGEAFDTGGRAGGAELMLPIWSTDNAISSGQRSPSPGRRVNPPML